MLIFLVWQDTDILILMNTKNNKKTPYLEEKGCSFLNIIDNLLELEFDYESIL